MKALVLELLTGRGPLFPLLALLLVAVLVFVIAAPLARHADAIAETTGLGGLWIGAVLLAAATSLPEVLTDVNAALLDLPDIGVGDLFGSTLANMLILAVLDLVFASRGILRSAGTDHARLGALGILVTAMAGLAIVSGGWGRIGHVGIETLAIVAVYLGAMRRLYRSLPVAPVRAPRSPGDDPAGVRPARPDLSLRPFIFFHNQARKHVGAADDADYHGPLRAPFHDGKAPEARLDHRVDSRHDPIVKLGADGAAVHDVLDALGPERSQIRDPAAQLQPEGAEEVEFRHQPTEETTRVDHWKHIEVMGIEHRHELADGHVGADRDGIPRHDLAHPLGLYVLPHRRSLPGYTPLSSLIARFGASTAGMNCVTAMPGIRRWSPPGGNARGPRASHQESSSCNRTASPR